MQRFCESLNNKLEQLRLNGDITQVK
jgi:hypothetical protein